jgi:peptide/nickel transport system substrate-binding protein
MYSRIRRAGLALVASSFLTTASAAEAATFRYASSADVLTLDPHAANEALTNGMKANIYEALVRRKWDLSLEPALAVSWTQRDPTTWRFQLRRGVTFHDGTPFTADDVVFSFRRNKHKNSNMADAVAAVKEVRKVDDYTVEYVTYGPDPVLLQELTNSFIMSRRWCEEHGATEPSLTLDKETYATRHANGTGPFMVVERVVDTRTVLVAYAKWWGDATKEHNLTRAEFRPIANAATRVSALLSGELDMMYPVPLQDIPRLKGTPGFSVLQGPEARVVFLGFDQWRDELLDMRGSGKNPFKDVRVRRAFYQAIDIGAIERKVMRGASVPTGLMVAKGVAGYDAKLAERYPYDPEAAKKLLSDAGYPHGFPVTLDCPNDRYVNDEAICQSVVSMLARVGVEVTLNAQTKSKWLDKIGRRQSNATSFYMLGWTPTTYDAHNALQNLMVMQGEGAGLWNEGRYTNPKVEQLVAAIAVEMDAVKRDELMREALRLHKEDFGHIPLHQQMLAWGVRDGVDLKLHPADLVLLRYVKVKDSGRTAARTTGGTNAR